jgi:hypothetical protein
VTRMPETIPSDYENPLPIPPTGDEGEDQAAAMEEEREIAIEAWRMGRKLRISNRGLRATRIPRMHPGTWRSRQ